MVVYTLHDPLDLDRIRYVGWTKCPRRRFRKHIFDGRNGGLNTHKANWVRSLLRAGRDPVMVIQSHVDNVEEAKAAEQVVIAVCQALDYELTNGTLGGDGTAGRAPWNKGKTGVQGAVWNKGRPGYKVAKHPPRKNPVWNKGLTGVSDLTRERMRESALRRRRTGRSPEERRRRNTEVKRLWRAQQALQVYREEQVA